MVYLFITGEGWRGIDGKSFIKEEILQSHTDLQYVKVRIKPQNTHEHALYSPVSLSLVLNAFLLFIYQTSLKLYLARSLSKQNTLLISQHYLVGLKPRDAERCHRWAKINSLCCQVYWVYLTPYHRHVSKARQFLCCVSFKHRGVRKPYIFNQMSTEKS